MRVLAFEDSYDVEALLTSGGVDFEALQFEQRWNTEDALQVIADFKPDILLLDHFIPPLKGLEVLNLVNVAVEAGHIERPDTIVGMSSASFANRRMEKSGADHAVIKFDLASLDLWPRLE